MTSKKNSANQMSIDELKFRRIQIAEQIIVGGVYWVLYKDETFQSALVLPPTTF